MQEKESCSNISVIIPYRKSRQRDREQIAEWNKERYSFLFKNAEIIYIDDESSEIFSRGRSINKGVLLSKNDYIIILDIDYFFDEKMVKSMINKQKWTVACKQENYYFANASISNLILSKKIDISFEDIKTLDRNISKSQFPVLGQMLSMPKNNFVKFFPGLVGYGWEDNLFFYCMKAIHGKEFRTNNKMYHIFHKRAEQNPYMKQSYVNRDFYETTFQPIENDRKLVRKFIKEHGLYDF